MERSPKTLIVDASTATEWFVEETDSEKADLLKKAHETGRLQIAAPDLLVYEVSNALVYHPRLTTEDLAQSIVRLLELDLDLIPPRAEFAVETAKIARKYAVSAYDASYIALADIVGTNCVTADEKLYRKLHGKKPLFLLSGLGREWNLPRE
ncbi:MAG TPA: type II toxin-antitoxin system VapC family toxin [Candidatus Bathyarchaeia archaeon]|nr:type II toxin-antitoxin system VapC family toxin [Candidatus Bathyarchaeia archaeon]